MDMWFFYNTQLLILTLVRKSRMMVCKITSVRDDKGLLKNLEKDVHQNCSEMS